MQIEITGRLNYIETPIEEAWKRASERAGLKVGLPDEVDASFLGDDPIIWRSACGENGETSYKRWFPQEESLTTSDGFSDGFYLEEIVRNINDRNRFYEIVGFDRYKQGGKGISLFFYEGGHLQHYSSGTFSKFTELLNEEEKKQFQVIKDEKENYLKENKEVKIDCLETSSFTEWLGRDYLNNAKFGHDGLFNFFLERMGFI